MSEFESGVRVCCGEVRRKEGRGWGGAVLMRMRRAERRWWRAGEVRPRRPTWNLRRARWCSDFRFGSLPAPPPRRQGTISGRNVLASQVTSLPEARATRTWPRLAVKRRATSVRPSAADAASAGMVASSPGTRVSVCVARHTACQPDCCTFHVPGSAAVVEAGLQSGAVRECPRGIELLVQDVDSSVTSIT